MRYNIASAVYVLVFWPLGIWDFSFPARDQTQTPCTGRLSLNHWTSREAPVVRSLRHIQLFRTLWTIARQASLNSTISQSLLKLISIELVMPSNHLIPCLPLLLLPSIFPSIRVFSHELAFHIMWPKYWSFSSIASVHSASLLPVNTHLFLSYQYLQYSLCNCKTYDKILSSKKV